MKKLIVFGCLALSASSFAVSMNFTGNFRTEASYYNKLNLGLPNVEPTKTFLAGRALLQPNLVIDDHFSIKSQWSLLTSPNFTPNATVPLGLGQGAYVFGDNATAALVLSRAWMEWTSDFGVFRLGRMPVSWGYGLTYDSGTGLWDDFQSTFDRFEYRLHLGHVVGALAYSKGRKLSVLGNQNDQEFYTAYLQYDNPELEVEGGILYEKQARATGQINDLMTTANPYRLPTNHPNPYPLSTKTSYPLSSNLLDVYIKKATAGFTLGAEVSWITGTATDYSSNGAEDLNAFGFLASAAYESHGFKSFVELLYASGDANLTNNQMTGFVILHRNRRPGLILGRELLGNYYSNHVGLGSGVVYGNPDSFSGLFYARPGVRYEWSPTLASGLELVIARKAAAAPGESSNLGVEVDFGTDYSVYKNFDLGLTLGYLFPGDGLGVPSAQGPVAVRTSATLRF